MVLSRTVPPALLLALLPMIAGCGAAATAEPEIPPRAGHVFLMRGTFDVFSWGIAGVVQQCGENRIDAHDLSSGAYEDVVRRILQLRRAGDTDPWIVLEQANSSSAAPDDPDGRLAEPDTEYRHPDADASASPSGDVEGEIP